MPDYSFNNSIISSDSKFNSTGSLTLDVKYIFTSFLQHVFSAQSRYHWEKDVRNTKIIIADKNAIDLGVVERRPSVILSRGPMGWSYSTRGQGEGHKSTDLTSSYKFSEYMMNSEQEPEYLDLVKGSITVNCISKHGLQAEEIANLTFLALTGLKSDLYKRGIHSITNLSIGEEQILRSASEIELVTVPVTFYYTMEKQVYTGSPSADLTLHYYPADGKEATLYESIHFTLTSGNIIDMFFTPENSSDLLVSYKEKDSGTWRTKVDLTGAIDGSNSQYTLPNGEYAWGYYKVFENIDFTFSGIGSIFNELPEGEEW